MAGKVKDMTGYATESGITVIKRAENKNNRVHWLCRCYCGKEFITRGDSLRNGHTKSCGCLSSLGEAKIQKMLTDANIAFQTQKTFDSCRFESGYLAKFDFYLSDYNYIIEYDGNTHYYANGYGWNNEDNLTKVKNHDIIKNEWCKNNNIPLIRIPYTIYDNLSLDDLLLETSKYIVKGDNNE